MHLKLALMATVLAAGSAVSHADTINVFNLAGATSAGTLSGTVTLNATTGKFTDSAVKFLYTGPSTIGLLTGTSYTFSGAPISSTAGTGYSSNDFGGTGGASLFDFDLTLPTTSLTGYTGGSLCTTTRTCSGQLSAIELIATGMDYSQVTSGTLTLVQPAVAVTPEPSSLLLLGTGVVAMAGFARRRFV